MDLDFIALQSALAGQYSIERELGRGGMGVVYLAREVQLDRPVALKVLPPELAARADLRERFLREARTAARLSHPNIVPIYRVDTVGGFVFFAMAFIDGQTLTQRVRAHGPLSVTEAARLIQEVAWALAYAHARGVVHRDVKPDNIIIERETRRALVMDFGIAQVQTATALTDVGQVMGTAHFMSPEQASGEAIDGRSDLYALGVVAHFALTGALPFDGPTVQSILAKHLTQPPPPLAAQAPQVPRALALAIDRCLAKEPAARWSTGEALAEAITTAQGQRRELPAPLRVWLQKGEGFKWLYAFYLPTFGLSAFLDPTWPGSLIKIVFPFALHVSYEAAQTRRIFAAGYDRETLVQSLREYVEQRREELAYEYGGKPALIWRVVRWLTYGSLLAAALMVAVTLSGIRVPFPVPGAPPWAGNAIVFGIACFATLSGGVIGLFNPGRRVERQDTLAKLRLRFWNGRLGERFARLLRWRLRPSASEAAMINRPTEIAIGVAAHDLYAALPREVQHRLRDLPDTLKKLESEARAMRKRVDELNERLATAEAERAGTHSAVLEQFGSERALVERRAQLVDEVRAMRDDAGRNLASTVAALENVRLDLLRLQAGAGSVESVTEAIDAARRIGDEVDRTVVGREDAARAAHPVRA